MIYRKVPLGGERGKIVAIHPDLIRVRVRRYATAGLEPSSFDFQCASPLVQDIVPPQLLLNANNKTEESN